MSIPAFDESELKVVAEIPPIPPVKDPSPVYAFPVTPKEAVQGLYKGEPVWQVMHNMGVEYATFTPGCIPDNVARCMVMDGTPMKFPPTAGPDMFGIDWVFVPVAGGSMVRPGKPFVSDTAELREKLVWPDVDSWDWDRDAEAHRRYLDMMAGNAIVTLQFTGWFERLISFMDFENAAVAMIDEDSEEDLDWLFGGLTDTYIDIVDHLLDRYPEIDIFCVHDDWGSNLNAFFPLDVVMERIVPFMKRFTDHVHSRGRFADLHCCGKNELMVPAIIAAGWDSWSPQEINDTAALYEQYGDQIILGVMPEVFDPDTTPEDEQRRIAREYAERFCNKAKPCTLNMDVNIAATGKPFLTNTFREELYRCSRQRYL